MLRPLTILTILLLGLAYLYLRPESRAWRLAKANAEAAQADTLSKISLVGASWHKSGFGSIAVASFNILNESDVTVSDIRFACSFRAESGTIVSRAAETIYRTIGPGKAINVRDFNLGFIDQQSGDMNCSITGFGS